MLPKDKLQHLIVGAVVSVIILILTGSVLAAILASSGVGIGKEVYDLLNKDKHTPEILDAIATSYGGMLVAFIFDVIRNLL